MEGTYIVYKIDNCRYCTDIIDVLDELGLSYQIRHAGLVEGHLKFLQSLNLPKLTFPQVFFESVETPIGGCDDTKAFLRKKGYVLND